MRQELGVTTEMALLGRDELQRAVTVLTVVPAYESFHPDPRCRDAFERPLGVHRSSGATRLSGKDKRPQSWTREERLEALLATHALSEEELGSWCRKRGIHTHHLGQWRQELVEGSVGKATEAGETRALRVENRALKKDLRRKEKTLAETTALLVLKKEAASIWGEVEDD